MAITDEDQGARPRPARGLTPPVLDGWDVQDLRDYIAALRAEIERAEAAITKRESHRSAADLLFRKP
jgi:uncharacterized small protein (DUF1192 family)